MAPEACGAGVVGGMLLLQLVVVRVLVLVGVAVCLAD